MKMVTKTWHCGNGHAFTYGDEEWHYEDPQYLLPDGAPVPRYCQVDWDETDEEKYQYAGDPCLDSSSLIYD